MVLVVGLAFGALAFVESEAGRDVVIEEAAAAGLALGYETLEVSPWEGALHLRGLRFPMPDACAELGPHWLAVDRVDVTWEPRAALGGTVRDARVEVRGVDLVHAFSPEGEDCVAKALSALGSDEPAEPVPLSQLLASLVLPESLRELEVSSLVVRDVRVQTVLEGEPLEVRGLEVHGRAHESVGRLRGELELRSAEEGTLVRFGENEARLTTRQHVVLDEDVRLESETTLAALVLEHPVVDVEALRLPRSLLTFESEARFEPERARTTVALRALRVLEEVVRGEGGATWPDDAAIPTVAPSVVEVDLASLAAAIPELVDLALDDVRATLRATPGDAPGEVRLALDAHAARLALPEERATVEGLVLTGRGAWRAERVSFALDGRAEALATVDGALRVRSGAAVLTASADDVSLDLATGASHATLALTRVEGEADGTAFAVAGLEASLSAPDVREPDATVRLQELSAEGPGLRARAPSLTVEMHAHRVDPSFASPVPFDGIVRVPHVAANLDGAELSPRELRLGFEGEARSATDLDLRTRLQVGHVTARQDALAAEVAGLDARLSLLGLDLEAPRARVALRARTRQVDLRDAVQHVVIDSVGVDSQMPWHGGMPERVSGRLPLGTVRYATADRSPTPVAERGELTWTLSELRLDRVLARSRARVRADLRVWPMPGATVEEVRDETPEEAAARAARRAERRAQREAEAAARGETLGPEDAAGERTLRASLRGHFDRGAGEIDVELRGRTVAMLGPLLGMDELALERARARATLHGTYANLDRDEASIAHRGELRLRRIGYRGQKGEPLVFPRIVATLDHRARGVVHDATLRLELEAPTLGEETLPHGITLVTTARADLRALSVHTETRSEDAGEIQLALDVDASLDEEGSIVHREHLVASGLHGLAAWMPPNLPARLDSAEVEGEGHVFHAIDAQAPTFEQTMRVAASSFAYVDGERLQLEIPKLLFAGKLRGDATGYEGDADVELTTLDATQGLYRLTVHDTRQLVHFASKGSGRTWRGTLHTEGSVGEVEQDFVPAYPMASIALVADVAADSRSMRLEQLVLTNERGGTRLELQQSFERIGMDHEEALARRQAELERRAATPLTPEEQAREERRRIRRAERDAREAAAPPRRPAPAPATPARVVLTGRLEQDLARLDGAPRELSARGRVVLPFTLESGDGSLFRLQARAKLEEVDLSLPQMGIVARGVRASVPVQEALVLGPNGFELVVNTERSAFARVRHDDLQTALDRDAFVEMDTLRVGDIELGPLLASLRADRNVLALDGVRMQHGDALITGQVLVDYLPGRESVSFRGNITGLRTRTSRSPLDANAAVVFTPSRLELDGRIQIVRVATAHLRGLLDLLDPYREDPSLNSLRSVLRFAHPEQVTLDLGQGLMALEVELGGIVGRFLDVSAIRGIPLGPLMNRHVAPILGRDE
ncbi:MAG: hypothetical protein H6722_20270 [Sandaracinus sp.]|nr:hypothetical protein [Sandaracinus sp.]